MAARVPFFGLRAQIVLSLCLMFLLSCWLLGFASVQITRRNAGAERARSELLLARSLAASWPSGDALERALCARTDAFALRVEGPRGVRMRCGLQRGAAITGAAAPLANGERLIVTLPDASERGVHAIARMLLFYVALTGLAAALVAYVLLTYLIVHPLERLTASAEQFARGADRIVVREQGSAEAVRLARTFNEMATMLRAERKQLTDRLAELEQTTAALQATQRQLIHGEKLASVGRLAAGVAHEIGNPLAAILGLLSLVRDGDLPPEQSREFLARIAAETERVDSIIRGLLDFARRDNEQAALSESCELHAAIDDAVSLLRPQKALRDVMIDVHVEPALGAVLGPQRKLTQVVLNLLLNALDALAGAGTIVVHAERDAHDDDAIVLRVEDDGPGIAPEIAHTLFEPFSTTKPAGQGTGLGLAVTHSIVESLSGSIEGFNRSAGGATFVVRLRRARTAPAVRAAG